MIAEFRKLFRQSAIYGLGTLSTKLAGFVLIPLYTRSFSVAEFGILGLLEVSAAVVMAFFGLSLYSAFFRWYWDKSSEGRKESLFYTVTLFQLGVAVVAYLAVLPFLKNISILLFDTPVHSYLIELMIISALIQLVLQMPNTLLRLQEKPWLFTLANVMQLIFSLLVTVYFVAYRHTGIEGIYYGQIIGSLAFAAVLLRFSIHNMSLRFESELLREMLAYCLPLLMSGVALVMLNVTDRYALKILGNMSDVGLYSYGFKLANTLNVFFITSVNFAIQPMIYRMINAPDNKRFYARLMTYYTYATMIFALGMMVYGLEITKLFAKRVEYFDAWYIFPFVIYSIVFGMMKDIATTGLSISKKTNIIAVTVIITAIINIILLIILIPLWGNQGAALSKLISMIVFFALTYFYAQKEFPIPYEINRLLKLLITAALLYLISLFFNGLDVILRILFKSVLLLFFPYLLHLLKFYDRTELEVIKNAWQLWRDPRVIFVNLKRVFTK